VLRVIRGIQAIILVLAFGSSTASAHHSFAAYDTEKEITLIGTVKEFQWTNPHIWIQLMVQMPDGKQLVEWSLEGGSPNILARQGWKRSSLKAGEKIKVVINPRRDGSTAGSIKSVTLADGRKLGNAT